LIEKLEALLANGQDSASLRFALANGYFARDDAGRAVEHARTATELDPEYSAAWRLLGQAQVALGQVDDAAATFERGIEVAKKNGDRQVQKEMQVFLKRIKNAADKDELR
jgi:Tfp pilus assembly protein PilF